MIGRIIEISQDHRYLSVDRGFLVVKHKELELGRIPLDDIAAVIGNAHGITYTNQVLVALAERNALLVITAANHNPVAFLWSVSGHHRQAGRIDAQLDASLPLKKRLWAQLVKAKIQQQAAVLSCIGGNPIPLQAMLVKVKSGDPDNIEAQAARAYWKKMFGESFSRNQESSDALNGLLNYGYTILRTATARAVLAAGLHPSLGLFHRNQGNPFRLVDDLMEPFRPIIDGRIYQLQYQLGVTTEHKHILAKIAYLDLESSQGQSPLMVCLQRLALSLVQCYEGKSDRLELPLPVTPLWFNPA